MSKLNRKMTRKLSNKLVSFFMVAIFVLPGLLSAKWAVGVAMSGDVRKVKDIPAMQVRSADKDAASIKPFEQPIISVTFDDGWESVYAEGLPILQKYGVHTTQYLITGSFDNKLYMSIDQVKSMYKAGHEIGAHTIDHLDLTQLDDKELALQLGKPKESLGKDFGEIKDFTSPYGAYNAHTLEMIGKYYRSQKNAEGDPAANELEAINIKNTFKPLNFVSYSVRSNTNLEDIVKLIKAAQEHNAWLVLTYHQIDRSGDTFSVNPDDFTNQMALLYNYDIRSATVGQFMDAYQKGQK